MSRRRCPSAAARPKGAPAATHHNRSPTVAHTALHDTFCAPLNAGTYTAAVLIRVCSTEASDVQRCLFEAHLQQRNHHVRLKLCRCVWPQLEIQHHARPPLVSARQRTAKEAAHVKFATPAGIPEQFPGVRQRPRAHQAPRREFFRVASSDAVDTTPACAHSYGA